MLHIYTSSEISGCSVVLPHGVIEKPTPFCVRVFFRCVFKRQQVNLPPSRRKTQKDTHPTARMSGCRIFVGRLNPSAREKDVERFFKGYGRIRDIDLKRGFGFVEFDDPRDAEDAVYELDGKELCNERVTIEHARVRLRGGRGRGGGGGGGRFPDRYGRGSQDSRSRNPPPMRTENRLIVENLSSRVSWQVSSLPGK
uniref:RRM domain-containing protein n=3 Tax=Oncorhynchus TaxID=8016 RepID=A0A8C8FHZ2_ONCTS